MGSTYLGNVYDHFMDALVGYPREHALVINGVIGSNVNINSTGLPANAGSCVHVQTTQTTGGGTGTTNNVPEAVFEMGANLKMMPCFLWTASDGYTVSNPGVPAGVALGGTTTNVPGWVAAFPAGRVVALVGKGDFELETTEFDTNQTYLPNQLLRAVTSNTDANAGKLTNQDASGGQAFATSAVLTTYTDSAVGVVSRGKYTNKWGVSCLAFWPIYLPGSR